MFCCLVSLQSFAIDSMYLLRLLFCTAKYVDEQNSPEGSNCTGTKDSTQKTRVQISAQGRIFFH